MKKFKRLSSIAMAAVMTAAMTSPAFAATITVNDAVDGETYKLYKIFDYVSNETGDAYSYTMPSSSEWKTVVEEYTFDDDSNEGTAEIKAFTLTPAQNDPNTLVVAVNEAFDSDLEAADFAAHLSNNLSGKTLYEEGTASENKVTFDVGDSLGYYFVDTTTGALCSLFNNETDQELKEKNELPEVVKKIVVNSETGEEEVEATTASINDSIKFRITVTDGKGTDQGITIHDVMDDGMTLDGNITVTDGKGTDQGITIHDVMDDGMTLDGNITVTNNAVDVEEGNYEIKTSDLSDDCTFEVVLSAAYVQTLDKGDEVVVEYNAVLNKDAEIALNSATNDNTVSLSYSKQTIPGNTVKVSTYQFDLVKVDTSKKLLTGAEFELYDAATGGNKIPVMKVEEGVYRVLDKKAVETEAVIEAGEVTIKGLGNGKYYLEEIAAPEGYNPLTARHEVKINGANIDATSDNGVYTNGVLVENRTGSILPSTGGIGTTIFYAAGIVLMAGAVFFVVRRKRA